MVCTALCSPDIKRYQNAGRKLVFYTHIITSVFWDERDLGQRTGVQQAHKANKVSQSLRYWWCSNIIAGLWSAQAKPSLVPVPWYRLSSGTDLQSYQKNRRVLWEDKLLPLELQPDPTCTGKWE